jgi:hypothetical protein
MPSEGDDVGDADKSKMLCPRRQSVQNKRRLRRYTDSQRAFNVIIFLEILKLEIGKIYRH